MARIIMVNYGVFCRAILFSITAFYWMRKESEINDLMSYFISYNPLKTE